MKIDVQQYIPAIIESGRAGNQYPVHVQDNDSEYYIFYETPIVNQRGFVGTKTYSISIPKEIVFDSEFFEVVGLLQGEMSKTFRGSLTFVNSEHNIMTRVMQWFEKNLAVEQKSWKWYIKANIAKPEGNEVEEELVKYWTNNCSIDPDNHFPTKVSYIESSKRANLANKGSLIIEKAGPLFAQFVQNLVHSVTLSMPNRTSEEIIPYMRGVIAAEACVNYRRETGHRRVFITATRVEERDIFRICLEKLGIKVYDCFKISDLVMSGKETLMRMHDLNLMSGHPDKLKKFNEMISNYTEWWHEKRNRQ